MIKVEIYPIELQRAFFEALADEKYICSIKTNDDEIYIVEVLGISEPGPSTDTWVHLRNTTGLLFWMPIRDIVRINVIQPDIA